MEQCFQRPAILPVVCSDEQPGTWSWSFCCLRPESAGVAGVVSKPAGQYWLQIST